MVRGRVSFVFGIAGCVWAALASLNAQVTVVQRSGPQTTAYSIFANQALGVTWSQASPFTGVSVFATIGGVPGSGFAYLTNRIGPGATAAANEIASTPVSFPAASTETQLFSGLSLPAGTYYLSLAGNGSWGSSSTPTVNKAAGVTLFADYATFTPEAYPPSSSVFNTSTNLIFRVTAAVPESSAAVQFLFGGGLLAGIGFGRSLVRVVKE